MAKSKFYWAFCLILLMTGCSQEDKNSLQTRFYENGAAKPIVAIVPLIDNSRHKLNWNVSDEITALVHYRLMQKDKLYLVDEEKVGHMIKKIKADTSLFDTDLSWVKKIFFEDEFVVFMELIHHEQTPITQKELTAPEDLASELNLSVRIRVIDIREEPSKVVLQEIIKGAHFVPAQFNASHFLQVEWGKENYSISPIGMAHAQISKELAARLEDYILLSMSKKYE